MKRAAIASVSVFAVGMALLLPAANAAEPSTAAPAVRSAETDAVTAAKKKNKKKVKKVTLKANHKKTSVDSIVKLSGQVKPKQKAHVGFQQKFPGSKTWHGAGVKVTGKGGKAVTRVQVGTKGTFKYRMVDKKKTSNVVKVNVVAPGPGPGPTPPPNPDVDPKKVTVKWPDGQDLELDRQYKLPVQVDPGVVVQVRLQERTNGDWSDVYGGTQNTNKSGKVDLVMSIPDTGSVDLRVAVTNYPQVKSDVVTRNFAGGGDTLYNVPLKLPKKTGQIVKAQEYPLDYPKLKIPNPIKQGETLTLPQIGTPAAGPPKCVTDGLLGEDCSIPGKQYRIMYTTERWYPDENGGGSVQNGTVAATGLLFVPPSVKDNAPVVVWAHPTLGQEDKCSVSRGVDQIEIVNGKTGDKTMGPGGMDINLTDVVFFLDQMLQAGYVVMMPDYLGIATEALDFNQTGKTYAVGPQEARDVYYGAQALQDGQNSDGWPGLPQAGNKLLVVGHSQGGHAALWTGISARKDWAQSTGLDLKGVVSVAPATDLNKLVDVSWNNQANWIIGPEIIQTWVGYLPQFALKNNTLSDASNPLGPNPDVLSRYESYCTTQAFAQSYEYFPNGLTGDGTPFMKNPNDPANQSAFYNWGQIFNSQTPVIDQGSMNSYPKDMPTQLISGTADQVVLSQVNAAMQENFCSAGAQLSAYWTPVLTGAANTNPPVTDAYQAADHLNVLAFPWTDDVNGTKQLAGGRILQFAADRFAGKAMTPDCAKRQAVHQAWAPANVNPLRAAVQVDTWYVFPDGTNPNAAQFYSTSGSPYLPAPTEANRAPALGTLDKASTSCYLQYRWDPNLKKPGQNQPGNYVSNPDCTQWGLYPYGKLAYDGASVSKGTWGGKDYPFMPPKP